MQSTAPNWTDMNFGAQWQRLISRVKTIGIDVELKDNRCLYFYLQLPLFSCNDCTGLVQKLQVLRNKIRNKNIVIYLLGLSNSSARQIQFSINFYYV